MSSLSVWCASYLNTPSRNYLLHLMIDSVLTVAKEHGITLKSFIIYAGHADDHVIQHPHVNINFISGHVTQFDTYQQIYLDHDQEYTDDDYIMFMDDDDLLMDLSPNLFICEAMLGKQYEPDHIVEANKSHNDDLHSIRSKVGENNWGIYENFSGTLCKYKYVKDYFTTRHSERTKLDNGGFSRLLHLAIDNLEDIVFHRFLESYCSSCKLPYIFHRLWSDGDTPSSEWMKVLNA